MACAGPGLNPGPSLPPQMIVTRALIFLLRGLGRPLLAIASMAPGPLPPIAVAYGAGLACSPADQQPTPLLIFLLAGISLLLARVGARRAALLALLPAFALAGAFRAPPRPSAGAARPDAQGPRDEPGPLPGPCAAALAARGLSPPTEAGPARLEVEARLRGAPQLGHRSNQARVEILRARQPRERPAEPPAPWVAGGGLSAQLNLAPELRPLPGDTLRAHVRLDDVEVRLPGGPEARRRLDLAGAACRGGVLGARVAAVEERRSLLHRIERARRRIAARIEDTVAPEAEAALLAALSVGDRSRISDEQNDRFAASGLAHVLSVSGLHLSLTILGLYRFLRWLVASAQRLWDRLGGGDDPQAIAPSPTRGPGGEAAELIGAALGARARLLRRARSLQASLVGADPRRLAALLTLPAVPAYALLTGAAPPVLRAAVGTFLFLLAQLAMRSPEAWSALAAAALAILIWDPAALHDPSFQLSFAACVGLLAISPGLRASIPIPRPGLEAPRWRRWLEVPLTALTTTLGATLATLPLTALYFQRASLAALPANVVAVPVGLVVTALCAIAAAVGLVAAGWMRPLLWLAAPAARALDWLAGWFASWPGARIPIPPPDPLQMIATWVVAIAAAQLRRAPRRALGALLLGAAAFLLGALPNRVGGEPQLEIHFLAVGQGDATLVRLPDGRALLVDAGGDLRGERDLADRVLLPQLVALGVRSLDVLALSHLHPDHVGSVPTLLDRLRVGELWFSGRPLEGRLGAPIQRAIERHWIRTRRLARGAAPIHYGEVRIEILGPPDRDGLLDDPLLGDNDASLILRIVHGEVTILLPGDVEAEGEQALLDAGADLRADLLKAPHHGSSTSSSAAFLERVRPQHVVFCVGYRNPFGFPRADVVERYRKRGCQLHRTDRGVVSFTSDGRRLERISE